MKKSFAYPIIFMSLLTAIFTFILSYLNYSTADRIATLQETEVRKKILYVFDINPNSDSLEEIESVFTENIGEEKFEGQTIYIAKENGETKAYAFPVGGSGLWGSIEGYASISADYNQLLGLTFTSQSETPGLGGRIIEESYLGQFRGIDLSEGEAGNYVIYRPAPGGNVDAIAGATLTSQSVTNFLNEDIENFITKRKGE